MAEPSSPRPALGDLIPPIPNDVALSILVRVPRRYHTVLSKVSKPIRSLISSPHFFATRSQLNCTQNQFYLIICLGQTWFFVYSEPEPNTTTKSQRHGCFDFRSVPPFPLPKLTKFSLAAVGPKIYIIGGSINHSDSESDVWVFDCRFHTWERGQRMETARSMAEVTVIDGKIFVWDPWTFGGEVLDTTFEDGQWEAIPCPFDFVESYFSCYELGGRFCVMTKDTQHVRFDTATKTWEAFGSELEISNRPKFNYDGEGVLICRERNMKKVIEVYDRRNETWKELKGIWFEGKKLNIKMVSLGGGRFVMVWVHIVNIKTLDNCKWEWHIRCAEIEVKKKKDNGGDEDWLGQVYSLENILSLSSPSSCLTKELEDFGGFACFSVPL